VDVSEFLARSIEPVCTAHAKALYGESLARLDSMQRLAMERWSNAVPMQPGVLKALRNDEIDIASLERHAITLDRSGRCSIGIDSRMSALPLVLSAAVTSPAVASALVWNWLTSEPNLASHLVQHIRDRAGLPGLRRRIEAGEPRSMHGDPLHIAWFADRQLDDLARWIEHVPASAGNTLAAAIENTEAQRAAGRDVRFSDIVPFVRQVASFLLHLSQRDLDPLGFSLAPDAQLDVDPPLEQRLEIAAWARRSRRTLCLRGQLMVMSIAVSAPWYLVLEVIVSELGRGTSPAIGLMLRLRGKVTAPSRSELPLFLCLPTESVDERGARFEHWLSTAYSYAVDEWRPWC